MLVADRAGDFPLSIVVMPDRDKLCISDILWFVRMMKSMNADFDSSVILEGVDFKCVLDECTLHLPADILFNGGKEWCLTHRQSGPIMIELEVIRKHGAEDCKIAVVIGIEEFSVECFDRIEKGSRMLAGLSGAKLTLYGER